jgi:hypothetical protein
VPDKSNSACKIVHENSAYISDSVYKIVHMRVIERRRVIVYRECTELKVKEVVVERADLKAYI